MRHKFRAWNTDYINTPIMEYFDLKDSIKDRRKNELYKFSDKTLMAFTGLLDKNGKEIYENDIVFREDIGMRKVTYNENCFTMVKLNGERNEFNMSWYYETEVIGNEFENPELLEQKAVELIEKFKDYVNPYIGGGMLSNSYDDSAILWQSKKCAKIVCDEVIQVLSTLDVERRSKEIDMEIEFYNEVKQILEKM